jgi:hypothetical protein
MIKKWKPTINPGIKLQGNICLNSLLYADDLTIIQTNKDDDLQLSIFYLSKLCQDYNLKISKNKTKTMALKGKLNVYSKIVLENTTLEQVQQFNYLGCETSFIQERDVNNKIQKFQMVCGTISRTLKNKTGKDTFMTFYKTVAVPVLSYGSESWVTSKKIRTRYKLQR